MISQNLINYHAVAVKCSSNLYRSGGVGLVIWLTGKLGHAWVGAWVVVMWWCVGFFKPCTIPCTAQLAYQPNHQSDPTWPIRIRNKLYCCYLVVKTIMNKMLCKFTFIHDWLSSEFQPQWGNNWNAIFSVILYIWMVEQYLLPTLVL